LTGLRSEEKDVKTGRDAHGLAALAAAGVLACFAFVVSGPQPDAHAKGPAGADLRVRSVAAPARVVRGEAVTVAFTVANNGDRTAGRSKVRAFLSRDTRRGRGNIRLLAAKSLRPLAPGAMSRETGTARIPQRTGTGRWLLIVCAASARDANSRNNCRPSSRRTTVSAYPNASNTGPTGSLRESTGNITVSTPGRVIENRKINGCITIRADNVTIRNVEIHCDHYGVFNVLSQGNTGLLVENTLIECGHQPGDAAITEGNYTIRRSELFGCENIIWAERNVVIEDNYIHDPIPCCIWAPRPIPHTDSIQIPSGAVNIIVRNNRVYGGYVNRRDFGNAAFTAGGNVGGVVVDNNIFAGGGYTVYCEEEGSGGNGSPAFQITNNRFSRVFVSTVGGFGPSTRCSDEIQSGNVYHETGQPLNLG
jgi:pectate lyase